MTIPKARKSTKFPFDDLKVGKYFITGEFERERQKTIGGLVAYYNKSRYPKKFGQRSVKGQNRVYRFPDVKK